MLDKETFKKIMSGLAETYKDEVSTARGRIYYDCLKNYSAKQVSDAAMAHLRDPTCGQFFPKPADIIRNIAKHDDGESSALESWRQVVNAVERFGPACDQSMFSEKERRAIRGVGGWSFLCSMNYQQMPFVEKNYITHFNDITEGDKHASARIGHNNVRIGRDLPDA